MPLPSQYRADRWSVASATAAVKERSRGEPSEAWSLHPDLGSYRGPLVEGPSIIFGQAAAVAFAIVLAASIVWFVRQRGGVEAGAGKGYPRSLPAGGEIFAIDVSTVTEIDYEQSTRKIIARRPGGSNDRFSIEVINGPDTVERCEGGAAFASILNQLSSIRARRELGREEASTLPRSVFERLSVGCSALAGKGG